MSWLKIDDGLAGHRKTERLLRRNRNGVGLAAMGLHTLAMCNSARYLTDGFVDREWVEDRLDDAKVSGQARAKLVRALVDGGQWRAVEGGWLIENFLEHNPSRAEVERRREEAAEKKRRQRKGFQEMSPGDSRGTESGLPRDASRARARPVPSHTRPTPTSTSESSTATQPQGDSVVVELPERGVC